MHREAWQVTVHGFAKSQTQLSDELENLRSKISVAENLLRDETISSIKEFC